MLTLVEHFTIEKEDILHPINCKNIVHYQQHDKSLFVTAKLNKDY